MTDINKRLRHLMQYDPQSGRFVYINKPNHHAEVLGKEAGSIHTRGYRHIKIDGKSYKAHRLAYLYMIGAWPTEEIDHINGNPADNRWENLRAASSYQNKQNAKKKSNNMSGFKGVHQDTRLSKRNWYAQITANGVKRSLGRFNTKEEAYAAYCAAAVSLHGPFARIE